MAMNSRTMLIAGSVSDFYFLQAIPISIITAIDIAKILFFIICPPR